MLKIIIKKSSKFNVNNLPVIHTCSNELEIPEYTSYEQFKFKLMYLLDNTNTSLFSLA